MREVLHGSFWAFLFQGAGMVCGYGSTWLIANHFGPRTVGLFNLTVSIIAVISLISHAGFPTAILRFCGEYGENGVLTSILMRMLIMGFAVAVVLSLLVLFSAGFLSHLFHDVRLRYFLYIMIPVAPFAVVTVILVEFLRGKRLIRVSESLRNLPSIFNLILLLILIFVFHYGYTAPALSNFIVVLLVLAVTVSVGLPIFKLLSPPSCTVLSSREILRVSLPMFATASMFLCMSAVDNLMLGIFRASADVGIYSVSLKLAGVLSMILVAINAIVAPKFSELYWAGKMKELKGVVRSSSRLIFLMTVPVLFLMILFAGHLLDLFGRSFVNGSVALLILCAGQFVNAACGSVGYFLDMTGHQKKFRDLVMRALMIDMILNLILIPRYGYNGAAAATSVSLSYWNIAAIIYIRKRFGFLVGYLPFTGWR